MHGKTSTQGELRDPLLCDVCGNQTQVNLANPCTDASILAENVKITKFTSY